MKSPKDLIKSPNHKLNHVVLLGAGASIAAFPCGDANKKQLPDMNNIIETLQLGPILRQTDIDITKNFEIIYSKIEDEDIKNQIDSKIHAYFSNLKLPSTATHYDRMLLSLRENDFIFTFNWDPFLFDAYERNKNICKLPQVFFLHGNVRIKCCTNEDCRNYPDVILTSDKCNLCGKNTDAAPLLYPIQKKDYFKANSYTSNAWHEAVKRFKESFTFTVYGYSAPESDKAAMKILKNAWLNKKKREFEQVSIIDIEEADVIQEKWKLFTPTNHFIKIESLQESNLWKYPRRSSEALYYPMSHGFPCEAFPLPDSDSLDELHRFIEKIQKYE